MQLVDGYCPMGCGKTLFLSDPDDDGRGGITCSYVDCPDPLAVDKILGDPETNHVVILDEDGTIVQHPLRERLDGRLFDCDLFRWLTNLGGPPHQLGRYRVRGPEPWSFERLGDV